MLCANPSRLAVFLLTAASLVGNNEASSSIRRNPSNVLIAADNGSQGRRKLAKKDGPKKRDCKICKWTDGDKNKHIMRAIVRPSAQ